MDAKARSKHISVRLSLAQEILAKNGIGNLLLTSQAAIHYFTDTVNIPGYLIISKNQVVFYTDSRFLFEIKNIPSPVQAGIFSGNALRYLQQQGLLLKDKTGLEYRTTTAELYFQIAELIGSRQLCDISNDLRVLFNFHDALSLAKTKKAVQISCSAFESVYSRITIGMTENELAAEISYQLRKSGAQGDAFSPIVGFGRSSALPHAIPGKRKLKEGECVLIDFGCFYEGIYTDMTRTFQYGEVKSVYFNEVKSIILEVVAKVKQNLQHGVSVKELDLLARKTMSEYSIDGKSADQYYLHALGHGIGYELHAFPTISSRVDAVLTPGQIVTIEPGLYIENKFGYRLEDMYLLQKDSVKKLTEVHV